MHINKRVAHNRKPTPEKYCEWCGKKLERIQRPCGELEHLSQFNKRKYCDRNCMGAANIRNKELGRTANVSRRHARKLINKTICTICGCSNNDKGNLHVHHIDNNPHNNEIENLVVVCNSCHRKIHHTRGVCIICGAPHRARGLCAKHYIRFLRYGNPQLMINRRTGKLEMEV